MSPFAKNNTLKQLLLHLKISGIDSKKVVTHIKNGKKDKVVLLSSPVFIVLHPIQVLPALNSRNTAKIYKYIAIKSLKNIKKLLD
jgi:hypothetical protein